MDSLNDLFTLRRQDFDRPVLVTGSSGCIGSWALAILVRAGVPAVSFDLDTSRRRPGLLMSEEELAQVTWVEGDIADAEAVDRAVAENGVGAILHLAALQVPFCRADPVLGARVNVVGTVAVFEAARQHGVRRIAYASSIAAHGAPEDSPYAATLYGAYKACDEAIARTYWQDWQVPSIALRPGIVYGVGRDQGMTSKTTVAILAAAAGARVRGAVHGRGLVPLRGRGRGGVPPGRITGRRRRARLRLQRNRGPGRGRARGAAPPRAGRARGRGRRADTLPDGGHGTRCCARTSATTARSRWKTAPRRPTARSRSCCRTGEFRPTSDPADPVAFPTPVRGRARSPYRRGPG